jgi:3-oxoadipate enol-lactonase
MYVDESGTGPTVLAIHGLGGGAWFFEDLARELGTQYRLLAVDLTGTGRSPGAPSMDAWIADVASVIAARTNEPIVLLGHSMGTIIALEAWRAWPQRIRALVLAGGLAQVRPAIRERLSQRIAALHGAASLAGWGPRVSPGVFSPTTAREHPDIVTRFEQRFESESVDRYVQCTRILLDADARNLAATVAVPTLAVTGADDQYAPPDLVEAFAGTIPGAAFEVLPSCAHLPFLEQPRAFAAVLSSFLRTC